METGGACFFFDFEQVPADERNMVWLYFTSSALRSSIVDWPTRARDVLARFRINYGRHVGDSDFVELVERLNLVSPEFAEWWPRHDIHPLTERTAEYNHPLAGRMLVDAISLSVSDNPEMQVAFLLPVAEANSISKTRKVIMGFRNGASPRPQAFRVRRKRDTGGAKRQLGNGKAELAGMLGRSRRSPREANYHSSHCCRSWVISSNSR